MKDFFGWNKTIQELYPKRSNMKLSEIPKMTRAHYRITVQFDFLEKTIEHFKETCEEFGYKLELEPDFQRGHIWKEEQQIAYIEYIMRAGLGGREIYFNSPGWMYDYEGDMQLVDGLQRITAILKFMHNGLPIFNGNYLKDFEDKDWAIRDLDYSVFFNVNNLKTRAEVLQWYLDLNSGIAHTDIEIQRVKALLEKEVK